MIEPGCADIRRKVVTFSKFGDQLLPAYGRLTTFDDTTVFVTFDDSEPMAMRRADLDWSEDERTTTAPDAEAADWPAEQISDDTTLALPFER